MDTSSTATLEYHHGSRPKTQPRWFRIGMAVVLAMGLVIPWVSFSSSTTPWDVVVSWLSDGWTPLSDEFILLAGPLFLIVPLFLWKVHLAVVAASWRWERTVLWVLADLSVLTTCVHVSIGCLYFCMTAVDEREFLGVVGALVILSLMVLAIILLWSRGAAAESVVTVALYGAYLANACIALCLFFDSPETGWFLTLATAVVMAADGIHGAIVEFSGVSMVDR
jgi:hypothetical protein